MESAAKSGFVSARSWFRTAMSSPLQRVVEGEDSENVSRLRLGCAQHVVSMTGAALNMKHPEFRSRSSYRAIPRRLVSDEDATPYTSLAGVLGEPHWVTPASHCSPVAHPATSIARGKELYLRSE